MQITKPWLGVWLLITIATLLGAVYMTWQYQMTTEERATLQLERDALLAEQAAASSTILALSDELARINADIEELATLYHDERNRNEDFERQIRAISGTVGTLDKLARTDQELLQKYSRVFFLSENYIPERLAQIPQQYILPGRADQYFHANALRFLRNMIEDAAEDGHDLRVISAYRSFDEQAELKGQFTQVYGSGANAFSADQGYSEHQLGTAVDLTTPTIGATSQTFANTDAYQWLLQNAHRYGFILSYPENNRFYIFEPWHWRFVGRELARDLYDADAHFYDWDQRKINEYLVSFFD